MGRRDRPTRMDSRVRERRRSVSRERGRRRAGLVLLVVVALAGAALFVWLRSSDVFAVSRIVATATGHVSEEEISRATAESRGVSLLRLSTGSVEDALLSLPYVRSAEVRRRFPDTLEVRLVEYEPVARLEAGGSGAWLVAEDGRALEKCSASKVTGLQVSALPLIVPPNEVAPVAGRQLPKMIVAVLPLAAMVAANEGAQRGPDVDRIEVSAGGSVMVKLKDGAELRLGDPTELKQKLMVAIDIVEQYLRDGRHVQYVDASVPDRVAVKAE